MKDTKRNLCDTCKFFIPECDALQEDVQYGDGKGNDNIIECTKYKSKIRIRMGKIEYYLQIAKAVAQRSSCLRRIYGAIIVQNDEIIATGYNGSPRGNTNCIDIGSCWRQDNNIPSGEQYEKCKSVHAEQNAIISASRKDMIGSTMYLYGYDIEKDVEIDAVPCTICERFIQNVGITRVITKKDL
jgi:dCMP deaminase